MAESLEEGWYTDPYARHQQRWFSAGRPTALVRDGNREGHDEPPDEAPQAVETRVMGDPDPEQGAADLYRAGDGYDPE